MRGAAAHPPRGDLGDQAVRSTARIDPADGEPAVFQRLIACYVEQPRRENAVIFRIRLPDDGVGFDFNQHVRIDPMALHLHHRGCRPNRTEDLPMPPPTSCQ